MAPDIPLQEGMTFEEHEWALGWRRAKRDHDRCDFGNRPFTDLLVDRNHAEFLAYLHARAHSGWVPGSAQRCYLLKGRGLVRPGALLDVADEVLYNVLVGSLHAVLREGIRWSQGDPDLAYPLAEDSGHVAWIADWREPWRRWRALSTERLSASTHVVFTDVSACYENMDIGRLGAELRGLGCPGPIVGDLLACLRKWAVPRGRGIPQGYDASNILAKVYMSAVDGQLTAQSINHLRYVDDMRVFCTGYGQALRAIQWVTETLSACGLNIQSAKTRIVASNDAEARSEIDKVSPVIDDTQRELLLEMEAAEYVSLAELEKIAAANADSAPIALLERAWNTYVSEETVSTVSKTLLHYLLPRLGGARSLAALQLVPELIRKRPEELAFCLEYVARCASESEVVEALPALIGHDGYVADHSYFLVLRWLWRRLVWRDSFLGLIRELAQDLNRCIWVRAYARALLARHGTPADLERLVAFYPRATDDIERAEIICCVTRMELSRRNSFLSRVAADSVWTQWASDAVRSGVFHKMMSPDGA